MGVYLAPYYLWPWRGGFIETEALSGLSVISSLDRSALLSVCLPGCCVSCCWTAVAPPESLTFCSCPNSIPPTILHLCTARRHLPSSACVTYSPALLSSPPDPCLHCFPLLSSGSLLNSLQRHFLINTDSVMPC